MQELRLEDYQAGRKGPSNPMAPNTGGLFGAAATATPSTATGLFGASGAGFSFNQPKPSFSAGVYMYESFRSERYELKVFIWIIKKTPLLGYNLKYHRNYIHNDLKVCAKLSIFVPW